MTRRCPKCKRFARKLTKEEKEPKYIGTYQSGIPNGTYLAMFYGDCWVKCTKCGIVDP